MKIPVAIIGATGTVGQKAIVLLNDHPIFEVTELIAGPKSIGKKYGKIIHWREKEALPERISDLTIRDYQDISTSYALSSIPANIAKTVEQELTQKGINIVSNAATFRMDPKIPLIIPEINSSHIKLVDEQNTPGKLITNPNCSTMFLALGLYPLTQLGKLKHVSVVTLQALSGAGYPGVSSMDILGNTVPYISGEEDKIESEPKKILGGINTPADFAITVNVNRVPILHGHSINIHAFFNQPIDIKSVKDHYKKTAREYPNLFRYYEEPDRPQPLKDVTDLDQRTHIGRIRQGGEPNVISLVSLGHNLVRGAAGAAMLNLELLYKHLEEK